MTATITPRASSARPGVPSPVGGNGARRRRRLLWPMLVAVTVIGIVFIGVYPSRTWLAQQDSLNRANHQLEVLKQQDAALAAQVAALKTDSEIERLARERFNLVRPGEESYAVNPAPTPPVAVPDVWPFMGLAAELAATAPG